MSLYRVTVEYVVYIVAKDELHAELDAPRAVRNDMQDPNIYAEEVTSKAEVDSDTLKSLVHHNYDEEWDDTTVAEAIDLIHESR